jgi:allantoin racemase
MRKVLVIVPAAATEESLASRRAQLHLASFGPGIEFEFKPVKTNPVWFDSYHDWIIQDLAVFEAGIEAQEEGYDAVCIDTMSDGGLSFLRSVLDIPVIGAGRAAYLMALMLGTRFSVLTMWGPWIGMYRKSLREYGLEDKCSSIRSIDVQPDLEKYLGGKEDVFPMLVEAGRKCIEEDGADVICMGSTSMYQAHAHLVENLPVPVINPGPLVYKIAETLLDLGLTQSRRAYRKPDAPQPEKLHAMLDAAAAVEASLSRP